MGSGTPDDVLTTASWKALASPSTTRLIAKVMISGCTRNTPIPIPLIVPATAAATRAISNAAPSPMLGSSVATMNPAAEATAPTDRSMPPVSIARVWQAARSASGMAACTVKPMNCGPMLPGLTIANTMTSRTRSPVNGTIGRSRKRRRHASAVSHSLRSTVVAAPVTAGSFGAASGCRA
jgi:hypothetical protein